MTFTIGNGSVAGTFSGIIQNTNGPLTLVMAGPSTQTLRGVNTYTGGTQVNGGELNFSSSANIPLSPNSISFGGTGFLQWATGNTLDVSPYIAPIPGGASAGIDTNGNNVTLATALSGNGGLTKAGAGTLTLTTAETYTGTTNITGGTLKVADSQGQHGEQHRQCRGQQQPCLWQPAQRDDRRAFRQRQRQSGTTALTIGANNGYAAYSGSLTGGSGLTKTGSGTQVLSGVNAYSGATNIAGGVLQISGAAPISPVTSGLIYQLDASNAGNYVLSSGAVTQMSNVTGKGNNFTNPGSTVTLVSGGSAFNNNTLLDFNGASLPRSP